MQMAYNTVVLECTSACKHVKRVHVCQYTSRSVIIIIIIILYDKLTEVTKTIRNMHIERHKKPVFDHKKKLKLGSLEEIACG